MFAFPLALAAALRAFHFGTRGFTFPLSLAARFLPLRVLPWYGRFRVLTLYGRNLSRLLLTEKVRR